MRKSISDSGRFLSDENSLALYLKEISGYRTLRIEEEAALAVRIRAGNRAALDQMVRANLRFVVSVSRNYQNQGLPLSDLINEGNLGLIRAARHFDEKKNFKFISYAVWWIRQSILQALADQSRIVNVPLNRVGAIHQLSRTRARLEQALGRQPTTAEIAETMHITERAVIDTMSIGNTHASLDAPAHPGEETSLVEALQDPDVERPDSAVGEISLQTEISKTLSALGDRERDIVRLYFGIGEETAFTLEEISLRFGLTRERVRQIKEKALRRLKHASRSRSLTVFRD